MRLSIHLSVFLSWNVSALLTFFINSTFYNVKAGVILPDVCCAKC